MTVQDALKKAQESLIDILNQNEWSDAEAIRIDDDKRGHAVDLGKSHSLLIRDSEEIDLFNYSDYNSQPHEFLVTFLTRRKDSMKHLEETQDYVRSNGIEHIVLMLRNKEMYKREYSRKNGIINKNTLRAPFNKPALRYLPKKVRDKLRIRGGVGTKFKDQKNPVLNYFYYDSNDNMRIRVVRTMPVYGDYRDSPKDLEKNIRVMPSLFLPHIIYDSDNLTKEQLIYAAGNLEGLSAEVPVQYFFRLEDKPNGSRQFFVSYKSGRTPRQRHQLMIKIDEDGQILSEPKHTTGEYDPQTGRYEISCSGFRYKGNCWHIEKAKQDLLIALAPESQKRIKAKQDLLFTQTPESHKIMNVN